MEKANTWRGVSLIVPVYNEEAIIAESAGIFLKDLADVADFYELIIVDDGSTDSTPQLLKEMKLQHGETLRIITNQYNQGSGRSLLLGLQAARYSLLATNFADRPFDLKELRHILPFFSQGIDFVVVSRFDRSANSLYRKLTSLINCYLIRLLFQVNVSDFQFVQIYRKAVVDAVRIESRHTFVPPEIIIQALQQGFRMAEYKSVFYPRTKGKAKCGHPKIIACALVDMVKFWFQLKFSQK